MRVRRAGTLRVLAASTCVLLAATFPLAKVGTAADEELALPFLLSDGATRSTHPVSPVLLPEWIQGPERAGDRDRDLEDSRHEPRGREERTEPAFPDVRAMLRSFPGASQEGSGRIDFDGDVAEWARLTRLLAAVDVAFHRRVRIEIEVRRASGPTLIKLSGDAPLGTLLVADAREDRVYPAGLQLASTSACAEMQCVRVGPRVVASAVSAGKLFIIRLAVHTSEVVDDVRFEARRLTLVAPTLTFSALVLEVPAAPGEPDTIRCGDLLITYRVTPMRSKTLPLGVRAFSVDATAPLFEWCPLPVPGGLLPIEGEDAGGGTGPVHLHARLPAAGAGITRHEVSPGLVVMEGSEELLQAESAHWERALHDLRSPLRLAFETDSGLRVDMPVARPARVVFIAGRLDPVVRRLKPAISETVAQAGPVLAALFTGRTLTVSFEEDRQPRVTEVHAALSFMRPRVVPIVMGKRGALLHEDLPGSSWAQATTRTTRLCRPPEIRTWRPHR